MLETAIIGAGLVVVGVVVTVLGAYQLGLVRAARKWDSSEGPPRVGRGVATSAALCGLLLLGAGVAVLASLVELPVVTPAVRILVVVLAGATSLSLSMYGAAKYADRVELNALIRTPSRIRRLPESGSPSGVRGGDGANPDGVSDPVVPPTARPGWVYRDAGGAWYLVVAAGSGYRLVSLPDFRLAPAGSVKPQLTAAGSVELAVWPLSESPEVRHGEAHSTT